MICAPQHTPQLCLLISLLCVSAFSWTKSSLRSAATNFPISILLARTHYPGHRKDTINSSWNWMNENRNEWMYSARFFLLMKPQAVFKLLINSFFCVLYVQWYSRKSFLICHETYSLHPLFLLCFAQGWQACIHWLLPISKHTPALLPHCVLLPPKLQVPEKQELGEQACEIISPVSHIPMDIYPRSMVKLLCLLVPTSVSPDAANESLGSLCFVFLPWCPPPRNIFL